MTINKALLALAMGFALAACSNADQAQSSAEGAADAAADAQAAANETTDPALAGTAQGNSGRVYAFAFIVNDGDILSARKAQDALASALHEF